MGDLVNLNKFRKAKQRRVEEDQATINREKFGRTKAEAKQDRQARERQDKALDDRKLKGDDSPGKDGGSDRPRR
jgi:hypothetical protein